MSDPLDGARVLITGGTGSLGQTLVRRLLQGQLGVPQKLIVFSRDEAKQHAMKATWKHLHRPTDDVWYSNFDEMIEFQIGDVRDTDSVERAVRRCDVVIHAAAMKQVPTCEYFPTQAIATNVLGADNVLRAVAREESVHTFVGVSTDKACKPINVMGMTKAIQERLVVEGNLRQDHCRMIAVRYGNVLSSRGSAIPLFKHQIASGGPVTITLAEMTRFLMTLDQAVDTIFAAMCNARRGEIFVPRVPSARIIDVIDVLIGERPIETVMTGIRPGEKIHEILISEEEAFRTTERDGYYVVLPHLPELAGVEFPRALQGEYTSAGSIVVGEELERLVALAAFVDPAMSGPGSPAVAS
jgi:FlaA1/EpsC-like NDP-sugar epimerase